MSEALSGGAVPNLERPRGHAGRHTNPAGECFVARVGLVVACLIAGSVGCSKSQRPTGAEAVSSVAASGVKSPARAGDPGPVAPREGASSSVETANYAVEIVPSAKCKKADTCAVSVVLEAKGDYHVNDKYPYRFKTDEPPADGITYPKPLVGRADANIETKKATLSVPFVAQKAGNAEVGGVLSLSVCSPANCLIDKQPLKVAVRVDE